MQRDQPDLHRLGIVRRNKGVEAKFLAYSAVNKQGQLFSGLIAAETGNSITLVSSDGKQHTLLRADLDEFYRQAEELQDRPLGDPEVVRANAAIRRRGRRWWCGWPRRPGMWC